MSSVPPSFYESLLEFYRTTPVRPGSVDLFAVADRDPTSRMGDFGALLCLVGLPDSPLAQVRVVWPEPVTPELRAAIRGRAAAVLQKIGVDEADVGPLLSRLDVVGAASLEVSSLLELARNGARRSALVVAHAARYRSDEVQPTLPRVPLKEDTWVPHLTALMHAFGPVAGPAGCYVVLDAGEFFPTREENRELLRSAPDSAVLTADGPGTDEERALLERLVELTDAGNLGQALEELDASGLHPLQALVARIQLLRRAGMHLAVAAELVAARDRFGDLSPEVLLNFAGHAVAARQSELAAELLAQALPELRYREELEAALATASGTGDEALIAQVEASLAERFPSSRILGRRRALVHATRGEFAEAAETARTTTAVPDELREYWSWLAETLQHGPPRDPRALRTQADQRFPQFNGETIGHIVEHLLTGGRRRAALVLLLGDSDTEDGLTAAEARALVRTLHQISVARGAPGISPAVLEVALLRLVRTLASNPGDVSLRFQVVDVLAPEAFGHVGIAVAAHMLTVLFRAPEDPPRNRPHLLHYRPGPGNEEFEGFLDEAMEWLARTPRAVLGARTLPPELLSVSADDALAAIGPDITHMVAAVAEDGDRTALHRALALAVAVAPHADEPDEDLVILRLAVSQLAAAGLRQDARDLAEQTLALTRGDPGRVRMAWTVFAEAYARASNVAEAVVGMACALAVHTASSWEEVWLDTILISRLMRDLGQVGLARQFIHAARASLAHIPDEDGRLASRLETMDLSLSLVAHDRGHAWEREHVESFLARAIDNLRAVLALSDEAGPAASLLANSMHIARFYGVAVPPAAAELLESALEVVDPTVRPLVAATAAAAPSPDEMLDLARGTQPARYHDDVGFDEERLAGMARRLLGSAAAAGDPAVAAFAIEATADHSVVPPGSRGALEGTGPRLTATADGPAEAAREISRGGIDVVLLGVSHAGLRRLVASGGDLQDVVTEPPEVFDVDRLRAWRETYPMAYGRSREGASPSRPRSAFDGRDGADANTFHLSTEGIGVSGLPARAVVVADTLLQVFPPGLLRIGDQPAASDVRLAAAPSLEWLLAARRTPVERSPARTAWIPHDPEADDTLGRLAGRLESDLTAHGFDLATGAAPPRHGTGAELVVVAAHGGVADENRFFRAVKDDVGAALAPGSLALAFANTAVVVLFVCSGGRVDLRPGANAVVGLVRQLLANGCSAVIAPPWPLETLVPPKWLPPFLAAMDRGDAVLDACFEANDVVRRTLEHEPRRWLAMTVYGDPYTTTIPTHVSPR
jgi:hypothetical protein